MRHAITRAGLISLVLLSSLGLNSCTDSGSSTPASTGSSTTPPAAGIWVATWGAPAENALQTVLNPGGSEQSFRSILVPTVAGTQERVHLSNLLGKTPVTIGAAQLAVAVNLGPAIDATRSAVLTFSGSKTVTLAAGQEVTSDPVQINYNFGERLAVSVYVSGSFGALTQHVAQAETNFENTSGAGNAVTDNSGASFATTTSEWYMLTGVDVFGSYQGTVALLGSSSVDGHDSDFGNTNSYPVFNVSVPGQDNDRPSDWLARQLMAAGYNMGVLNAGTAGDPAGEDTLTASGSSIAGVDRIKHDVLDQANVKAVVIYLGGVDLRSDCVAATNVEASLTNMVSQAQAAGVRVILATIPPSEYCTTSDASLLPSAANPWQGDLNPGPENPGSTQRRALNVWIRGPGSQLPGVVAIADFDAALMYPTHPDFLMPNLVGGDNYHPNGQGYGIQSAAIPLKAILGQ